jgi:hypothetical protein
MNAEESAKSFAVLAWLATTLVMFAIVARVSWTAGVLFAVAAVVALACAVLLSRLAS